jgi:hypothetical protein
MTAEAHSATHSATRRGPQWRWRGTFPPRSTGAAGTPIAAPAHLPDWELSWWSLTW